MDNVKVVLTKETIMKSNNITEAVNQKQFNEKMLPKVWSTPAEKHPHRRANPVKTRR